MMERWRAPLTLPIVVSSGAVLLHTPMRTRHLTMTIDEFHVMAREPGWKYEYWSGQAHISSAHRSVSTSLDIEPRACRSPCLIRPAASSYEPTMIAAYVAAFRDTIDYCDWEEARIVESARDNVIGFFSGARGKPLPASRLALIAHPEVEQESVVGAALVAEMKGESVQLELLFVTPEWQRMGVATALVSATLEQLYESGHRTLKSRYNLGNEESRAWHRAFGFVDDSDLLLAESYCRLAEHELWRREKVGDLTPVERQKLNLEIDRWRAQADQLSAVARRWRAH